MESVYGGALVSLAASSATSVAQVFFLKPDDYKGGFCARVTTHTWCRIYRYSHADDYEKSSRVARRANRAWAFQEKLLLTGIIYFSDGGIFWGCRPMIASEFVPDRLQHQSLVNLSRPEDKSYPWRDVVLEYFTALLTYGSDRLPALAAIAARRHEVTDDQYLAGLWRDRLLSIPAALVLQSSGQARVIAVAGADLVLEGYWFPWCEKKNYILEEYARVVDAKTSSFILRGLGCFHKYEEFTTPGAPGAELESIPLQGELEPFFIVTDCCNDEMF